MLLADSMGQCIPSTDSVIKTVVRDKWEFEHLQRDIADNKVNVGYKNIIIWMGAQCVGTSDTESVGEDISDLINTIRIRNGSADIYISSILPQPKQQRQLHNRILNFNRAVKTAVLDLQQQGSDIHYLPMHGVYLDQNRNIIHPIVENFEDGFHLNLHGAHRLRQFWLQKLGLSK